jgi:flagellar basal body-associated protein FliL
MTKTNKTNEAESVKKLVWRIAWALFVLFAAGFSVLFTLMLSANAQQDLRSAEQGTQLSGMVSQTQLSQMFAQVTTESRRERDVILSVVASNSEKAEANSKQISKVDSKVSKILGIVELLVDKIREDDDD